MEKMTDFFAARVKGYDEHMIRDVEGCREGYERVASLVPLGAGRLLDLGAGTGLELDYIFEKMPELYVTAIDLTKEMLDVLMEKHGDKNVDVICGDYFEIDLGRDTYDCAVSVESLHHFEKDKKTELYRRVRECLREGGVYIECDYMVETQAEEDFFFAERRHLAPVDEYYHYDTPCTVDNQIKMLMDAGFGSVERVMRRGATTVLLARR